MAYVKHAQLTPSQIEVVENVRHFVLIIKSNLLMVHAKIVQNIQDQTNKELNVEQITVLQDRF